MIHEFNDWGYSDHGHKFDSLGICIQCNGCWKLTCHCAGAACVWEWAGGLPAKKPLVVWDLKDLL